MATNEQFHLTEEQLRKLTEWIDERSTAWAKDDDSTCFDVTVSFSFHFLGRDVIARIGEGESLVIEDALEG